jgi:hypothetical protein
VKQSASANKQANAKPTQTDTQAAITKNAIDKQTSIANKAGVVEPTF